MSHRDLDRACREARQRLLAAMGRTGGLLDQDDDSLVAGINAILLGLATQVANYTRGKIERK